MESSFSKWMAAVDRVGQLIDGATRAETLFLLRQGPNAFTTMWLGILFSMEGDPIEDVMSSLRYELFRFYHTLKENHHKLEAEWHRIQEINRAFWKLEYGFPEDGTLDDYKETIFEVISKLPHGIDKEVVRWWSFVCFVELYDFEVTDEQAAFDGIMADVLSRLTANEKIN